MTNEEARAIGERLTKCDGFRWLPGMVGRIREVGATRLVTLDARYVPVGFNDVEIGFWLQHAVPDLRDPCTLGGLLALVREAWGDSAAVVELDADGFKWIARGSCYEGWRTMGCGATEAEALVVALKAAPSNGAA